MTKDFENLIKLQRIDNKLIEIDNLKGDLPQIVRSLELEIKDVEDKLEKEKKREKEINSEIRELEGNIQDAKSLLNKYNDQLYLVTSNKEYDAISSEIDTVKQSIDKYEYTILERSEEMQNLKESIKNNKLTQQEKLEELEKRKSELETANKETRGVQEKLKKEREKIVKSIRPRFLREYERIAKAKDGVAIVPVKQVFEERKNKSGEIVEYIPSQVSCGGCYKIVPPQKVVEIRTGRKVIRCEFCGRILYWDEESSIVKSQEEEEIY